MWKKFNAVKEKNAELHFFGVSLHLRKNESIKK